MAEAPLGQDIPAGQDLLLQPGMWVRGGVMDTERLNMIMMMVVVVIMVVVR